MKKVFCLSLALVLLFVALVGCQPAEKGTEDGPIGEGTGVISEPSTDGSSSDPVSGESAAWSPVSDFEYKENETGVTIVRYTGSDADVVIPGTIDGKPVTELGSYAFDYTNCWETLVSVKMPDTVKKIGMMAFQNCSELTTVELSKGLRVIEGEAFSNCTKLSEITLPDTLTEMYDKAFVNCTSLKHITIPKSLTYWGSEMFVNAGLEAVTLEEGVSCMGSTAFAYTHLREIEIPGSIKELPWQAVAGCYELETIILHEGVETIENDAFRGAAITEIVIPKSVKSIQETAFGNCEKLKAVKFEGDAPEAYLNETTPEELTGLDNVSYTVYYHEGANGFTSPEWCGYSTQIWNGNVVLSDPPTYEEVLALHRQDPDAYRDPGDLQPETQEIIQLEDGQWYQSYVASSFNCRFIFLSNEEYQMTALWDFIAIGSAENAFLYNAGAVYDDPSGEALYRKRAVAVRGTLAEGKDGYAYALQLPDELIVCLEREGWSGLFDLAETSTLAIPEAYASLFEGKTGEVIVTGVVMKDKNDVFYLKNVELYP